MNTAKKRPSRRRVRAAIIAAVLSDGSKVSLAADQAAAWRKTWQPRETAIVRGILEYLRLDGRLAAWRQNTGASRLKNAEGKERVVRFSERGAADIQGVLRPSGRFVALEVKRPGGVAEPHQRAWGQVIEAAGGVYRVVHSIDEARAVLDELVPRGGR